MVEYADIIYRMAAHMKRGEAAIADGVMPTSSDGVIAFSGLCWQHRNAILAALKLGEAVAGIADDYMTSEHHHPGYVLIPTDKFETLRTAALLEKGSIFSYAAPGEVRHDG